MQRVTVFVGLSTTAKYLIPSQNYLCVTSLLWILEYSFTWLVVVESGINMEGNVPNCWEKPGRSTFLQNHSQFEGHRMGLGWMSQSQFVIRWSLAVVAAANWFLLE